MAFSAPNVKKLPASLKNIYKELISDGFVAPDHGNLESWANQGVLLLNTVLTIGKDHSHSKLGWEEITDQIIRSVQAVFILWGKSAQLKNRKKI